jgi:hypothetical protein
MCPREDAKRLPGLGGSAEGRVRRQRSGGGHGSSDSGDRAAQLDQQAAREGFVMHKRELRSLGGRGRRREGCSHRAAPMADSGARWRVHVHARSDRGGFLRTLEVG